MQNRRARNGLSTGLQLRSGRLLGARLSWSMLQGGTRLLAFPACCDSIGHAGRIINDVLFFEVPVRIVASTFNKRSPKSGEPLQRALGIWRNTPRQFRNIAPGAYSPWNVRFNVSSHRPRWPIIPHLGSRPGGEPLGSPAPLDVPNAESEQLARSPSEYEIWGF